MNRLNAGPFGLALALTCFTFSAFSVSKPKAPVTESWQQLARAVGQNEENREPVIKKLRRIPTLSQSLREALATKDRSLSLEVISALNIQAMVPELLERVRTDQDGFLTLAVNSMMNEKNQKSILAFYSSLLDKPSSLSNPVVIAILEPLGRLGVQVPRRTLLNLKNDGTADVRASLLYYLRMMALRNRVFENLDLVTALTKAPEYQIRLQAISISAELRSKTKIELSSLKSRDDLMALCTRETQNSVKEECLHFVAVQVADSTTGAK